MKKLISALMAGAMMFGLVACGGGSTASPSPSASAPAPSASAPVGVPLPAMWPTILR